MVNFDHTDTLGPVDCIYRGLMLLRAAEMALQHIQDDGPQDNRAEAIQWVLIGVCDWMHEAKRKLELDQPAD